MNSSGCPPKRVHNNNNNNNNKKKKKNDNVKSNLRIQTSHKGPFG